MVCRRATLPVDAADLLLSRIDLPIRRFVLLSMPPVPTRLRPMLDLVGAETDGVRLNIEPPIREVLPDEVPTLEVRPELTAGCLAPVGVEGLPCFRRGKPVPVETEMPIEPPIRPRCPESEPIPVEREILPELERLLEGAAGCFAIVKTDGLSIRIELPMLDLEPGEGRSILIDRLRNEDTDGVLVLMEPLIRDLELVIDRLGDEDTDGVLVLMEPPIRDRLLGLIRAPELLLDEIELDRLGIDRVIDIPLGLLRLGVDRLIDILLELPLRLGIDRLDEIELDRLGVGTRLTDDLLELLLLGTERLGVIELDRLGVGDLLTDDRLELLRLGIDRLELRLTDIELDRLGVDRLTDDLLELLRLGVLALAGGADLATDVFLLELLELELFLELLPAKTGSATRASSKMAKINRKSKACPERSRWIGNRNLFL